MPILHGYNPYNSIKFGTTTVDEVYVGSNKVYPTTTPPVTDGLLIWLDGRFAPVGNQWVNNTGITMYDATLFNSPTFANNSMVLNGSTQYGQINTPYMSTTDLPFTLCVYFSPSDLVATNQGLVGQNSTSGNTKYGLYRNGARIYSTCNGMGQYWQSIQVGSWYMATLTGAASANTSAWKLYISPQGQSTVSTGSNYYKYTGTRPNFNIGAIANGQNLFNGKIGSILLYNKVLTQTEVTSTATWNTSITRG